MKRHLVMDLFHGNQTEELGEWKETDKALPDVPKACKVKAKLSCGGEVFAYFYKDQAIWVEKHGQKRSYFWNSKTHEPLFNVTHWKSLKE